MGLDRRGCVVQPRPRANRPTGPISDRPEDGRREEPVDKAKPFDIPKREVWEAFKRVKANQGAAGVDRQSIADFEAVVRELLSSAGAAGRYSEGRRGDPPGGHSHRRPP